MIGMFTDASEGGFKRKERRSTSSSSSSSTSFSSSITDSPSKRWSESDSLVNTSFNGNRYSLITNDENDVNTSSSSFSSSSSALDTTVSKAAAETARLAAQTSNRALESILLLLLYETLLSDNDLIYPLSLLNKYFHERMHPHVRHITIRRWNLLHDQFQMHFPRVLKFKHQLLPKKKKKKKNAAPPELYLENILSISMSAGKQEYLRRNDVIRCHRWWPKLKAIHGSFRILKHDSPLPPEILKTAIHTIKDIALIGNVNQTQSNSAKATPWTREEFKTLLLDQFTDVNAIDLTELNHNGPLPFEVFKDTAVAYPKLSVFSGSEISWRNLKEIVSMEQLKAICITASPLLFVSADGDGRVNNADADDNNNDNVNVNNNGNDDGEKNEDDILEMTVTTKKTCCKTLLSLDLSFTFDDPSPLFTHFLHHFTSLTTLNLSNNYICGALDGVTFATLISLKHLNLAVNSLEGDLPNEIAELKQLVTLNLSNNKFKGLIPHGLWSLDKLTILSIHSNAFIGSIPDLSHLVHLRHIDISLNQFTGDIPASVDSLKCLSYLNFSFNGLTGSMSPNLSTLSNLKYYNVSENELSGKIPGNLEDLKALEIIDLRGNNFVRRPKIQCLGSGVASASRKKRYKRGKLFVVFPDADDFGDDAS